MRPKFLLYVPNSRLTAFHNRSPWLMLPRAFSELAYDSTLVCGELTISSLKGVRVVQTGLVVKTEGNLLARGIVRSIVEPLLAFREMARQAPDVVIVSPIRSSLATILMMVFPFRLVFNRSTHFILKSDSSFEGAHQGGVISNLSRTMVAVSSHLLDLVSVETSCGVERAKKIPGIARERVVRVPIGYPKGYIEQKTYGEIAREPVILCVARIARMKGQDVLLKAFSLLAGKYPDWSVRLVGPEDDRLFKKELVEYVNTHGLRHKVFFLGSVEERMIDAEYTRASVFCLPSVHSESAGQVKYEATACGVPVVTTDVPCGPEAIAMGWRVARAGDPAALAKQLDLLMDDELKRREVSERAQSLQRSYDDVAREYLRSLNTFVQGLPGGSHTR